MSYLTELRQKLATHQGKLDSIQTRIRQTPTADSGFDQLIADRNSVLADIAAIRDRIYFHNKPGAVVEMQIPKQHR